MENNEKCDGCNHIKSSKTIDRWNIDSPCYTCIFNIHMVKTNNYSDVLSTENVTSLSLNPFRPMQ